MFNIFKKKAVPTTDLGWLHTDIHSHLIPGIDDGVPDAATSVKFIRALMDLGLQQFIMTPHIYDEVHPNTPQTINAAHEVLYREMQNEGLSDVYTHSAAEYMLSENFSGLLAQKEMKAFPDRHLLIEMSWLSEPLKLEELIFQIQTHGYKPIMAHPERYVFYFNNPDAYHKLKEMGCLLQVNLLSPAGYYGKDVAKAAQYMIKNKLYDLGGTDLHHERHLAKLTKYVQSGQAYKDLGHLGLKNKELFGQ
ncbi:histidinol phosphatase [Olivibacter sp. SDN3]|uniref:tyrosine-protein phosphatase n=1 Tax=Olivibacter sp. SDN3 TaxID=2764720 RepID=UPI00165108D7|nr:CpsB/CapC family capsule biosynthesis tyrosine phosphatase [Olivibacter sp. SDN3]QNL51616.1 histidinol phosphatase [Olivibacter sp. SDN3]